MQSGVKLNAFVVVSKICSENETAGCHVIGEISFNLLQCFARKLEITEKPL